MATERAWALACRPAAPELHGGEPRLALGACPAHIRKSLGGLGRHCSPYPSDPSAHRIFRQILWSSLKGVQTQGQCKPEPAAGWHTHADRPAAASSEEAGATGWQVLRQPHPQRTGRQAGAVGMRPCFRHSPGQQGASGRGTGQAWAMQHSAGTPAGPTLICFLGAVVLGTERLGHGLVQKQRYVDRLPATHPRRRPAHPTPVLQAARTGPGLQGPYSGQRAQEELWKGCAMRTPRGASQILGIKINVFSFCSP